MTQKVIPITFEDNERNTHVRVHADRYAAERNGRLRFLSVGGESMAVRAVLAALASQQRHTVRSEDSRHGYLWFPTEAAVRFKTARLPSGLTHGVIWREDRADGLLIRETDPEHVYRAVYEAFPATLIPKWAGWLSDLLRRLGWLTDLACHGMNAGLLRTTPANLDQLISRAVQSGAIHI